MLPTYFEANPTKLVEPTLSATLYFNLNALPIRMQPAYFRKPTSDLLSTLTISMQPTYFIHTPHSVYPNLLPNFTSIHFTHISILVDLLSQFLFWIETYKDKVGGGATHYRKFHKNNVFLLKPSLISLQIYTSRLYFILSPT